MAFQTIGGTFSLDRTGLFTQDDRYVFSGENAKIEAETFALAYEDSSFSVDESGRFWTGEFRVTDAKGLVQEELDFSCKEEPIQSHPNWSEIATKYGYDAATQQFPKTLPDGSSATSTPSGGNSLYMATSYVAMNATFKKSQTVGNLDEIDGLFDRIGKISGPSYQLIPIPVIPTRNWLKLTPRITSRAGVFEVAESWMLSGPGGWNSIIYG